MTAFATSCGRKRRCCLTEATWQEFWIETRIVEARVELHAVHLQCGQRYISKADDVDTAAAALAALIQTCPPAQPRAPFALHRLVTLTGAVKVWERVRSWMTASRAAR